MNGRADNATVNPRDALAQNVAQRNQAIADYKAVLDERGNALIAVNEKSGPRSKAYVALDEKLKDEKQQLVRIRTAVRRPLARWHVRPWVMILIALGLALLEAPANKFLFDVALQSSGFVSYAVSAGVTAFLLFLAHFAGRSIRQIWSDYRGKVIWSNLIIFLVCFVMSLVIIGVLTVARAAFASVGGTIGELMGGVAGNVTALGPLGALFAALGDTSALVLACINMGGIVTTFVIAFFSHDSDRDYDHAQRAVDHLETQMRAVHDTYLKERARIIKQYTPDLVGFSGSYNTANRQVVELKTRMQMPLDEDDRFVLTDLDQMSEDADRASEAGPEGPDSGPQPAAAALDPSVTSMSEYRRSSGAD
jgi:hypothetical protein